MHISMHVSLDVCMYGFKRSDKENSQTGGRKQDTIYLHYEKFRFHDSLLISHHLHDIYSSIHTHSEMWCDFPLPSLPSVDAPGLSVSFSSSCALEAVGASPPALLRISSPTLALVVATVAVSLTTGVTPCASLLQNRRSDRIQLPTGPGLLHPNTNSVYKQFTSNNPKENSYL